MIKEMRLQFQRGDLAAIALVILLALCVAFAFASGDTGETDAILQVYQDGVLLHELSLQQDTTLEMDGNYHNTISIQNGRAAIAASDCPGEDCVRSGWISAAGRSIVCLPNRVELRIAGARDVDFVVG